MRDLINMGKMIGPRMFRVRPRNRITRSNAPPAPIGIMADGVDGVIHAVRQVLASGADWVKMYGSTGGFDDVSGFQTFTFEEVKAAVEVTTRAREKDRNSLLRAGVRARCIRAGVDFARTCDDMDDQTMREMVKKKIYTYRRSITTQYYVDYAGNVYHFPPGAKEHCRLHTTQF